MLNDWINEVSKHKQLLFLFFRELCNFFRAHGRMFVCFYFQEFFLPLLTNARPPSSVLLIVCRTGVKISRILFETDEYLCPLTVCYPPWCDRSPCNPSKWCHHHYTVSCIFLPNGPLTYVGGLPRESREFLIRNLSAKRHLWHLWRTSRLQLWIQKTNHKI